MASCPVCKQPLPPAGIDPAKLEEAAFELGMGNKIQAIKLVREATNWGLKEAKDYVECPHASPAPSPSTLATSPLRPMAPTCPHCHAPLAIPGADPAQMRRVVDEIARNTTIEAIKIVRELTGWGLQQSRDFVVCPHRATAVPGAPPAPARSMVPCLIIGIVLVVILGAIAAGLAVAVAGERKREAAIEARNEMERRATACPSCGEPLPVHTKLDLSKRARVAELLRVGQKFEAIKDVRTATGWGLKQAKDYVECPHPVP